MNMCVNWGRGHDRTFKELVAYWSILIAIGIYLYTCTCSIDHVYSVWVHVHVVATAPCIVIPYL